MGISGLDFNHQNASLKWSLEKSMNAQMGVWIDHRKDIVVAITDQGEEIGLVISQVEKNSIE